jgi:type IV secretory pathway TraG/TraD family ATPase VirD4
MPSSEAFPEQAVDPLAPVEAAGSWLVAAATHILLGLLIGTVIARVLRSRHLHWSWSACSLAILVVARNVLGGWASTAMIATAVATVRGLGWHRRDLEDGDDLARMAAARRGPLDALRAAADRLVLNHRVKGGPLAWFRGEELIIGTDEQGRLTSVPFGEGGGGTHALVVGATGSGKTVTQTWMTVRAIELGRGAIVVDPKGDRAMREEVQRAARAMGRQFFEWTPTGPSIYNPYARGSETEIADKVLAGERFTEPHYLRQAQRYLGHVVRGLRSAEREVTLREIVQHLDPEQLELLARTLNKSDGPAIHSYLDALTPRQRADLSGVRDRLAILAESDIGEWLDPRPPAVIAGRADARRLDLLEAARERAVVYFDLQADRRPLLTQMLGAAIVQDLLTTVAALQARPVQTLVVIDEFSAVAADQVVRLFGRARSAGVSLVLGTQELSDLRPPGHERLLEQVIGNLSVVIAHRQVVPESATMVAELAGTRSTWRTARHSDGRSTRTRTREGVLGAGEVMGLQRGWAAVIVLVDGCRLSIARIFSARPRG